MVWGLLAGAFLAAGPVPQGQQAAPAAAQAPRAAQPAAAPAEARARKLRIAVLDVQLTGAGDRKTVEGLSPLLASEVARRPGLTVVAGSDLRALVGFERQKQLLGCTEGSCLTEIAGALGVGYLVASECSKVGNTWLLSLSLLDAGKAVALKRLTRRAYSDDGLVDEAVRAVDELLVALPEAGAAGPAFVPLPPPPAASAPSAPSPASPVASPAGYHQHDGFLLGLELGFGGLRTAGGNVTISGPAGAFALSIGGAVSPSLAVYFQAFNEVDTSPTFKNQAGGSLTPTNVTHSLMAYGVGATWYSPSNYFVAATLALGSMSLEASSTTVSSKYGPAFRLSAGKEWWVSTDWAIGGAVHLTLASNRHDGLAPLGIGAGTFSSAAAGVAFSATYN